MKKTFTFLSGHWSTKAHILANARFMWISKAQDKDNETSSSSNRDQSAYLRRREQVRKAQQTHRERKEQYFKTLESEVLRLRANEAGFLKKIRELSAHVGQLEDALRRNDIDMSTPNATMDEQFAASSTAEHNSNISTLHQTSLNTGTTNKTVSPSSYHPVRDQHTQVKKSTDTSVLADGMEFVLTLEKPCLGHIHLDLNNPSEPSGHVLTASMPMLNANHYPQSFTDNSPSLEASKAIFDRLTTLSSELVCDDEFSPIQAWNYIVDQPLAYKPGIGQLRKLAENLLNHIKCYGFGAVVEKDICVKMVAEILTSS
ncbi:hypothetical protein UA08_02172 [Talaromyces atroroseus]|uniref:BZIP domain-containing protein n=1 Tax=Talaromyces atroroseus TaxID=1441469 RepID=A0A225ATL4_TALAT|nr:hypothetical protein UA08_02172 [Talaromyces atroroseus]OKL61704.1 hypothetical protein UA08_02172 [Talaromyces atroroseus]